MMKKIAILGSTGSIGTQALQVIDEFPGHFSVTVLTGRNNVELLAWQAKKFLPEVVVISNRGKEEQLRRHLKGLPVNVLAGDEALLEMAGHAGTDLVLSALVGYAGLRPTLHAIAAGKSIALANKETMVIAGDLVNRLAKEHRVHILPVDSEHSAIFQCLTGEEGNPIEKVILTASGGPFRGKTREFLKKVRPEDALNHPNWCMGNKITIDSATLMNKGLEAIEARWLFHLDPSQIEVCIHPQSIIHSMVQFEDGSVKAQLSLPDMRMPILYALAWPERIKTNFPRYSPRDFKELHFEIPDLDNFRNLAIAFEAMKKGGNAPCIMNAANEIAVEAFLNKKIGFLDIPGIIEKTLHRTAFIPHPGLYDYILTDREARIFAQESI